MDTFYQKLAKMVRAAAIVALIAFMTISIAGSGMGMQMEQGMTDCMFATGHETSWCPMQIQDHIRQWKSLLAGVPLSVVMLIVVFVLMGILIVGSEDHEAVMRFRLHEHIRKKRLLSLFEYLRQAYSRGVLNQRIYCGVV